MNDKSRVIIEIRGGEVALVSAAPFVDVVVVDHDRATVDRPALVRGEPSFQPQDYHAFDGGFPEDWPSRYHLHARKVMPRLRVNEKDDVR